MYPSFASEIWKSCVLLCASKGFPSHKIVKFLLTFSSRHFMVLFFAIWIHMKISITALSLMISTSRSSVNTSCYCLVFGLFGDSHSQCIILYTHTSEILWVQFQTIAIKRIARQSKSHKSGGFTLHMKVTCTVHCYLFSVQ